MNEIDDDIDGRTVADGLGADEVELVAGAGTEHDPAASMAGTATFGLINAGNNGHCVRIRFAPSLA
ncbi:hypothetical protein [Nonomuraea rubra]|uniref:Uncharacterized protein n=1 Tax=Nonomuraea rubra TaxID=46180 RepID=A0A7X0TWW7_9ACTN|nr:hypothetical protein [Nonomuraea rubra]MBB6546962.1 hypothetical protein [Nonomuraea rubra]